MASGDEASNDWAAHLEALAAEGLHESEPEAPSSREASESSWAAHVEVLAVAGGVHESEPEAASEASDSWAAHLDALAAAGGALSGSESEAESATAGLALAAVVEPAAAALVAQPTLDLQCLCMAEGLPAWFADPFERLECAARALRSPHNLPAVVANVALAYAELSRSHDATWRQEKRCAASEDIARGARPTDIHRGDAQAVQIRFHAAVYYISRWCLFRFVASLVEWTKAQGGQCVVYSE